MALQTTNGSQVVKDFFQDKEGIEQEQTPSTFKSGEEMPITRVDGFYKVKGIDGTFSCRHYAEQAYKEFLYSKTIPELDKEIRYSKKREKIGLAKKKEVEQAIEKKQEWLETH